jgi:predicted regulator of Ras-like GTPase activity (Roadblock/LC7/MglB family)
LVSIVIIIAMVLLLLPIIGILMAVGTSQPTVGANAGAAVMQNFSGVDLNDRLSKITLTSTAAFKEVVAPPSYDDDPMETYKRESEGGKAPPTVGGRPGFSARIQGLVGQGPQAPSGAKPTRLALPGTGAGTVRPAEKQGTTYANPGEGLNPLAARFTGSDRDPSSTTSQPGARLGLPGQVSNDLAALGKVDPGFGEGYSDNQARAGGRLGLPGKVAGGFTVAPSTQDSSGAGRTAAPARRPELPGAVAASAASDASAAQSLDIRAILRGESVPRGLPGTVADLGGPAVAQTPKPNYTTGPLPPPAEQGTPLGAVPFNANLLQVRAPMVERQDPRHGEPHDTIGRLGLEGAGLASYEGTTDRIQASGTVPDFDATRIVEDFDLPDTGFETHVFSTAELVDVEDLGLQSFDARDTTINLPEDLDLPVRQSSAMSPLQESRAHDLVAELVGLADVVFVKLVAPDGTGLLSAGVENGDAHIESNIAALFAASRKGASGQGLGETGTVALESERAALLISPVHAGTVLAVLVNNPSRLGLLRRQVRKPIVGLRSLLMESSVS